MRSGRSTSIMYRVLCDETVTNKRKMNECSGRLCFRVFKLGRYNTSAMIFKTAMSRSAQPLSLLFYFMLIANILFASAIYYAENISPESNPSDVDNYGRGSRESVHIFHSTSGVYSPLDFYLLYQRRFTGTQKRRFAGTQKRRFAGTQKRRFAVRHARALPRVSHWRVRGAHETRRVNAAHNCVGGE